MMIDCQTNFNAVSDPIARIGYLQELNLAIVQGTHTLVLSLADTPDSFLAPVQIEQKRFEEKKRCFEENKKQSIKRQGLLERAMCIQKRQSVHLTSLMEQRIK